LRRTSKVTFQDIRAAGLGRLDVACSKCDRRAVFWLPALIRLRGPDYDIADFLEDVTDSCPRRDMIGLGQCGAHFANIAKQ
jgi:hypothetical protein